MLIELRVSTYANGNLLLYLDETLVIKELICSSHNFVRSATFESGRWSTCAMKKIRNRERAILKDKFLKNYF